MALTYMQAIGRGYPNVGCYSAGDGSVYSNIIYISGDPIPPQGTLDTYIANHPAIVSSPLIQQVQSGVFGATSTNAVIPYNTSVPTITDGIEIFSLSYIPTSVNSKLTIRIQFFVSHSSTAQRYITGAIFRNSTCIRATIIGNVVAVSGVAATIVGNQAGNSIIELIDAPNTLDPVTYSFRVGSDNSSGTLYINQGASGESFGGGIPEKGVYTIVEIL
jgi:hypothetical protein